MKTRSTIPLTPYPVVFLLWVIIFASCLCAGKISFATVVVPYAGSTGMVVESASANVRSQYGTLSTFMEEVSGGGGMEVDPPGSSCVTGNMQSTGSPVMLLARDTSHDIDGDIFNIRKIAGYTLDVSRNGIGSGTVTSDPAGINCGPDCSEDYGIATSVTLMATPDGNSSFSGWLGDCNGTGNTTTIIMDDDKSCTAIFTLHYTITETVSPSGSGTVTCSPNPVDHGTNSTCTITAGTGYSLQDVNGTCGGTLSGDTYITNAITSDCTVEANFIINNYTLELLLDGTGNGTVTSNPAGIDCGSDCTERYEYNTDVTLTASAMEKFIFAGWGGDCSSCGSNATCEIIINNDKSCSARFVDRFSWPLFLPAITNSN
jgi:hypothetical protein